MTLALSLHGTTKPNLMDSALVDALPIPLVLLDHELRVTRWNPAFVREFPVGDLAAKSITECLSALNQNDLRHALETGGQSGSRSEFRISSMDRARTYLLRLHAVPPRMRLLTITDHTEAQRLSEELHTRAEALEQSNADLQQFAYVASHDLQEPLRMVASYTQVLAETQQGKLGAEADDYIHFIVDGAQRMQRLVNDLLEYARVTTKAKPLTPTPSGGPLDAASAALTDVIVAKQATVTVGPMPTVLADDLQLSQVFQNLLSNALKFHGPEAPKIRIEAARKGAFWEFSVIDDGIGIDPKYFPKLFVLFQRLHTKDTYPGTGIGLALCKKVIERHGGRLWVESAQGKGCTFRFTLQGVQA